jgi:hypothetical protein
MRLFTSLALLALLVFTFDASAGPFRNRRGGGCGGGQGGCGGGQAGFSSGGCSSGSCGSAGNSCSSGTCASCGSGSYAAGGCATCGTASATTAGYPDQSPGYHWQAIPGVSTQLALVKDGVQIGGFDLTCNCYAELRNGQWSDRGAKCPTETPKIAKPVESIPTPAKKTTRADCPGCDCGCPDGVCACRAAVVMRR